MKQKIIFIVFAVFLSSMTAFSQGSEKALPSFSQSELEDLVGSIALFPDPLLAQLLPASTYPLEIVQAARIVHNKEDFSKIDSQNWDASVKAIAHYPSVLKMMDEKLDWTKTLGEAVLSQQEDVMQAIQVKRQQAQEVGNLKSTKEQTVHQSESVIEILPADPRIVYVPIYNPQIVYVTRPVHVFTPMISFIYGSPLGPWFDVGFFWPSRSIFYCGPRWWGSGWHDFHNYQVNNITIVNNRNIYRTNINRESVRQSLWVHNDRHGNPFGGRSSFPGDFHSREDDKRNQNASEAQRENLKKFQEGIHRWKREGNHHSYDSHHSDSFHSRSQDPMYLKSEHSDRSTN